MPAPPRSGRRTRAVAATALVGVILGGCGAPEASPPGLSAPTTAVVAAPSSSTTTAPSERTKHVAPDGSDVAPGTAAAPWRTLQHALSSLLPGETLLVAAGSYVEDVRIDAEAMRPGSADQPIHVRARPGEEVVIVGLLWLTNPSHWHLEGIDVTWRMGHTSDQHMVKIIGGEGWSLTDAELSDARSYAALLVGGGAKGFRVAGCYIHDTHPANDQNQDHLIYVDNGPYGHGVIEGNVLARSPNGRGVKLGPGSLNEPGTDNIVIRDNTVFDNRGPSNIQLSGSSSHNEIVGNRLHTVAPGSTNVSAYRLTGIDNVVSDNVGWRSSGVADFSVPGLVDGGGNVMADPTR